VHGCSTFSASDVTPAGSRYSLSALQLNCLVRKNLKPKIWYFSINVQQNLKTGALGAVYWRYEIYLISILVRSRFFDDGGLKFENFHSKPIIVKYFSLSQLISKWLPPITFES